MPRDMNDYHSSDLIGPLYAEGIDGSQSLVEQYISSNGNTDAKNDPFIMDILSGKRVVLSGVRGSGKTMILKTADVLMQQNVKDTILKNSSDFLLPVYISYSGFRNDVSLQEESELTNEEIKIAREIFRGYFFMSLLQSVLGIIDTIGLKKNVFFNFFGLRTKIGIEREINKAIDSFKRIGFREIIKSKKSGLSIGIKIVEELNFAPEFGSEKSVKEVTLDDMQKTDLFKKTVTSICKTYGINKMVFLFDEVHYLKFLQNEFFNILFGFRNYHKISYCISAYPTYMDYGDNFDVPDDAQEINVSSTLYKPSKEEYEKQFFILVKMRLNKYGHVDYTKIITDNALELLIVLVNGNPRIILQTIDYLWKRNLNKKITISNITQDSILDIVDKWYLDFMKKQANRFKTNYNKSNEMLNFVKERLSVYNKRNNIPTSLFLINDEIYDSFCDTINLLHYSRIIDRVRISSFGSTSNKKGRMYLLTPIVGWYYGIFTRAQLSNLPELINETLAKDKKIQFDSIQVIQKSITNTRTISCPAYNDGKCPDYICNGSFSEKWLTCPFHQGISLEIKLPLPNEVNIDVLNLSTRIISRLKKYGHMNTLKDILSGGIEGLLLIPQIGQVRSKNIYYMVKEYVDDNL